MFGLVVKLRVEYLNDNVRYLARAANAHHATASTRHRQYGTVVEAIVESAFVTWIGLLLYEICLFAPTGHITVRLYPYPELSCLTTLH